MLHWSLLHLSYSVDIGNYNKFTQLWGPTTEKWNEKGRQSATQNKGKSNCLADQQTKQSSSSLLPDGIRIVGGFEVNTLITQE